jgi:SAM-dependent methyltransferase
MTPKSAGMSIVGELHARHVFGRRIRVLANHLATLVPPDCEVLDVGCGDGSLDRLLSLRRPDLQISGVDVLVRPETAIPVQRFDGHRLPVGDATVDVVMLIDVLHHTEDPTVLLREARRVARRAIVLKDHCRDGLLAGPTLRLMDWVGNAHHGVALPYNYWTERRWRRTFDELGLRIEQWIAEVGLYPWPLSAVFGRRLHFLARLTA